MNTYILYPRPTAAATHSPGAAGRAAEGRRKEGRRKEGRWLKEWLRVVRMRMTYSFWLRLHAADAKPGGAETEPWAMDSSSMAVSSSEFLAKQWGKLVQQVMCRC